MIRAAVLAAALVLPAVCGAEQVWRWQDATGTLHYSNVPEHVPSYAEPLRGAIGRAQLAPLPAVTREERDYLTPRGAAPMGEEHHRPHMRHTRAFCGFGPYGLTLNSTDPSELVKQVSALDALRIPWRTACY